jgi:hypothetical protein
MNETTEKALHAIDSVVSDVVNHVDDLEKQGVPASKLAEAFAAVRDVVDEYEAIGKRLAAAHEKLRSVLIPAAFEREDIKSFTTKSGHRVTVQQRVFASIVKETQDEAYDWLRKNGLGDLIKPTVNSSSLSATAKELAAEMKELPPDLFKVAVMPTTSFTKAK